MAQGTTVTVNVQFAMLFELSVTVQVTVVVPTAKQLPEAGVQTTALGGKEQLSEPVGVA